MRNERGYDIARAVLNDASDFESATVVADDDDVFAVELGDCKKCIVRDESRIREYIADYRLFGTVCILQASSAIERYIGGAQPCITYAYTEQMPPHFVAPFGTEVKRLATSLASLVVQNYTDGCYDIDEMAKVMRDKGVFGAITDGSLAGFIGRHADGSMGMLQVFPQYRRRGYGAMLETFLINYIMTFGRTPYCDVYAANAASVALQRRLGLTAATGYTYWCEFDDPTNKEN